MLTHGQGLLMPSESGGWFGVKVATATPGNAARGLRRIDATHLYDSETLTCAAILDGVALTALRTPAVAVAARLDRLRAVAAPSPDGLRLVLLGTGRRPRPGNRSSTELWCATRVVLAVGSHEPSAREIDGALMGRATVVVESREVALREAGDVVLAVREGRLDPQSLTSIADRLGPRATARAGRPLVVKTSGRAWEDRAVAVAVYRQGGRRTCVVAGLPDALGAAAARGLCPHRPRAAAVRLRARDALSRPAGSLPGPAAPG